MKQKELNAVIGIGAGLVVGAIAYMVAKKKKQRMEAPDGRAGRKHSHIRKARHAHEPDFTA